MIRYTVIHDKAKPARRRVADADKPRAKNCVHGRTLTPHPMSLDVTICPTCEGEAPLVAEAPGDRGHGD